METPYEARLRETVEQLRRSPAVEIRYSRRGMLGEHLGDDVAALQMLGEMAGVALPECVAENFHRESDFAIAWGATKPNVGINGEFRIVHIGVALMTPSPDWPIDVATNDRERQTYSELKFFDTHPFGGTGTCAAFRLLGTDSPEIWYYDPHAGFLLLDLSYGEYLDALLLTRGLYHWQYLFADPYQSGSRLGDVVGALHHDLEFLASVFDDDDFSGLTARLAERQEVAAKNVCGRLTAGE